MRTWPPLRITTVPRAARAQLLHKDGFYVRARFRCCSITLDARPVADLRDRGDRLRVRHLRTADAAADCAAGLDGARQHRSRDSRIRRLGGQAVLLARVRGRPVWAARRLSDGPLGTAARADVEHPAVRVFSLCGRVLDVATGTGDVALEIARQTAPSVRIVGADFTQGMLVRGREKIARYPVFAPIKF